MNLDSRLRRFMTCWWAHRDTTQRKPQRAGFRPWDPKCGQTGTDVNL